MARVRERKTRVKSAPPRREIPFGKPQIGDEEKQAVLQVLSGSTLVHGPKTHEFEEAFAAATGAPFAVSVGSCTAGMHLVYEAWGIGAGDEVIVPAQTHSATAHAVVAAGGTPVFIDAERKTGNINIDHLEALITSRTRAIAVVHFLGVPVDMVRVLAIARRHNLKVLEDCALALGATYQGQHAGLLGGAGCFSFYPVKHMTTAEGGMVITRDKALAEQLTRTRALGVDRTPTERKEPGVYDVSMHGYNYRMNELQAAIGVEQLKKVPAWLVTRRRNARRLREKLAGVSALYQLGLEANPQESAAYCHSIILENRSRPRAEMARELNERGVGTSVYYPKPVPHMTYYRQRFSFDTASFPVAAEISHWSIALPVGPHLADADIDYIAEQVRVVCTT